MKKAAIVLLFILTLILVPGLMNWLGRKKSPRTIQFPSQFGQGTELAGTNATITRLDLDSFRARLKAQGQNIHGSGPASIDPTAASMPAIVLVIANGLVIDGTGADPISNGMVVIRGDRIMAVGDRTVASIIPSPARVIDGGGKTIMPGVINAHVHYSYDPTTRRRFLVDGVTATCDLGCPLGALHNFERDSTRQGQLAARGFHAGPIITAPGGYPAMFAGCFWHYEVANPAEARAAVEDLINRGVDVIKIALEPGDPHNLWPVLTLEQVQAIVETAHGHGILVRAHVRQAAMLDIALDANVDVVEHVPLPFCLETELRQLIEGNNLRLADLPAYRAQLLRMAEQGVVLVPTLDANICIISELPRLESEGERAATEFLLEIVRAYRALGGVVALGNDFGCPGVAKGKEIKLLLAAGLTPMEVIEAGTSRAAFVSGYGDELGTLEPAKVADLIVIDGNPLNDIEGMSRVDLVIRGGKTGYIGE